MSSDAAGLSGETSEVTLGLLHDVRFQHFALAKALQQIAQNALVYGLFIAFIAGQDTYVAGSAFVLASVLPSVLLSLPGGIVADRLPNKLVIIAVAVFRVLIVTRFIGSDLSLLTVVVCTFLIFTLYQFHAPAENEAVVMVTRPENTTAALAWLQALSLLAQVIGAGAVAPLAIDLAGGDALFILVALLFVASGVYYWLIPNLTPPRPMEAQRLGWWSSLPEGYRAIRGDRLVLQTTVLRVLNDTAMLMVLVAAPKFIEDTLDSSPENAIYIASPGAIGLAVGLMVTPALSRLIGVRVLSVVGYVFFAGVLACLPFIQAISGPVLDTLYWWDTVTSKAGLSPEIATTLVLLPFAGFGSSVIQVSSRAAVYARIHPGLIGQVLATQAALGSVTAVIPTFIAGGLLDLLPVEAFLAGLTAVTIGAAVFGYAAAGRGATTTGEQVS
jgi:hypothetical protein